MDFKKYFEQEKVILSDKQHIAVKIGGLITAARLYSHLSQAELAAQIGTKQPSVARAEKGEMVPSIEFLFKIAKAIKTEFIFPKFGFMEDREKSSNYWLNASYATDDKILRIYPSFAGVHCGSTLDIGEKNYSVKIGS